LLRQADDTTGADWFVQFLQHLKVPNGIFVRIGRFDQSSGDVGVTGFEEIDDSGIFSPYRLK
jgi:hypothetical protein